MTGVRDSAAEAVHDGAAQHGTGRTAEPPPAVRDLDDVLYLFPLLFGAPGGIQAVCHDILRAMTRGWPSARHRVLLYQDREVPGWAGETYGGARLVPCGTARGASRLRYARAFAGAVLRRRPSLVVAGHAGLAPLAGLSKRLLGVPCIVWLYGVEIGGLRGRSRLAALRRADRLVAISRHTRRELAAVAPAESSRSVVLPCAVGDRFGPGGGEAVRRRLGMDRAPMLLTVARYDAGESYKGYDLVLRALPAVLTQCPDTRYVLVGQGDDLPRVRALARDLGVGDAVIFAGRVSDEELPAWYDACDLFVMPSRGEGFGLVYVEALACGKPVIAGDRDGASDALLDGRLGRMVDPDDPERLAEAVLEFLTGRAPAELTDPARLRRECLRHFGFPAFEERVRTLVAGLDA